MPGAITFAVHFSPHVSKIEPRPDHPMYMPKIACTKQLGISSSSPHSMSVPTTDISYWKAICSEFHDTLSCSPILYVSRDENADSQPSAMG